ncbi:serine/threonine protein kinase, partial [bacterium]|nr:serine/threonine protein kinase [bacterium]
LVLDRRVAVKILHPHLATDNSVMRFRREAIAAARLAHPNVVSIFDTISEDSVEAIVMELVDGTTLRRHLDRHQRLSPDDALHIGTSVCDALAAAHASGLVHRDIKPANILLCRDGRVKIADFGIAKAAAGDGLTREGTLVGTAAYLSPEQVEGLEVDGRADLYALGLVLYEALTGSLPFSGDTDAAVALARLRVTPPNAHR